MALRQINVSKLRSGDTFAVDHGSLLSACIVTRVRPIDAASVEVWVIVPGEGEYSVRLGRDVDVLVDR